MDKMMTVISPGLLLIMQRFPDQRDLLRSIYLEDDNFKTICQDYRRCSEALKIWTDSTHDQAVERVLEYQQLLSGLDFEIQQIVNDATARMRKRLSERNQIVLGVEQD